MSAEDPTQEITTKSFTALETLKGFYKDISEMRCAFC